MLITTPHYENFSSTSLEELTLQLALKISDLQKDTAINTENSTIITVDNSVNNETANITANNWIGSVVNGVFTVKDFFPLYDFPVGVGSYPFNRGNICDALFHLIIYQHKQELSTAKNPGKVSFIDWGVTPETTIGASMQCAFSLNITDLPIIVTVQSDQTILKAKPYLS